MQQSLPLNGWIGPEVFSPSPVAAPTRQKIHAARALRTWRENRRTIDRARSGAVGESELSRCERRGARIEPLIFTREAIEKFSELSGALSRCKGGRSVAGQVLRFLGLVGAVWADTGECYAGAHWKIARRIGWGKRTGERWVARLTSWGYLQTQAAHVERGAYSMRMPNVYGAGMMLQGLARASGHEPSMLGRKIAELRRLGGEHLASLSDTASVLFSEGRLDPFQRARQTSPTVRAPGAPAMVSAIAEATASAVAVPCAPPVGGAVRTTSDAAAAAEAGPDGTERAARAFFAAWNARRRGDA